MEVSGNALQWVTRICLQIVDSNTRNSMEVQIWSANKMYNFRIQSDISPPDEVFSTCNANSNNNSNSGYGIFRLIYSAKICLLKMFFSSDFRSESEKNWGRTCLVKNMSDRQFCQFRFQRFSRRPILVSSRSTAAAIPAISHLVKALEVSIFLHIWISQMFFSARKMLNIIYEHWTAPNHNNHFAEPKKSKSKREDRLSVCKLVSNTFWLNVPPHALGPHVHWGQAARRVARSPVREKAKNSLCSVKIVKRCKRCEKV